MPTRAYEEIALVGGGHGVGYLAKNLKNIRPNISAIMTVFDRGGHTGKLRDSLGGIAIGDIRRVMVALAQDDKIAKIMMSYRFADEEKIKGLENVPFGNLMFVVIHRSLGGRPKDIPMVIHILSNMLGVKGKIIPVSLDDADVKYRMDNGQESSLIHNEGEMSRLPTDDGRVIVGAYLEPKAKINKDAQDAIMQSQKIVLCAGSLNTSLIPNFLVSGFREALQKSNAKLIYVVNLMTHSNESPGFTATRFARVVHSYIGKKFDAILVNKGKIEEEVLAEYRKECSFPVEVNEAQLKLYTENVISEDFVKRIDHSVIHSEKLAGVVASL